MTSRLTFRPIGATLVCCALAFASGAFAQDTQAAAAAPAAGKQKVKAGGADEYPDKVEIDPFGGISLFSAPAGGLGERYADGGVGGIRVTVNPTEHLGLEFAVAWSRNNVEFKTPTGGSYPAGQAAASAACGQLCYLNAGNPLPPYAFGEHTWWYSFNPVWNFRARGSKVIPYITAGIGAAQWTPTPEARNIARNSTFDYLYHSASLNDNLQPYINYGGGVKWHFSDHFGLRLDARGISEWNPTFDLPNYNDGGIFIPRHEKLFGFQGTVGLEIFVGQTKCPPMPPPPPAPAPLVQGTITGAEGQTICQGKPVTLHSTASGPAGHTLKYAWTLNGQPSGENSADFSFTPNNTGDFQVAVTVTDTTPPPPAPEKPAKMPARCWVQPPAPQPAAPVTASTTVTVSDVAPQITNISASSSTLSCAADTNGTHTTTLTANATGGACGGNLSYKWTVSEGSVTNDTSATATFDASSLNFEGGAQNQTKTVTATLTVTTDTGKTATQTTQITVNCPPQYVRLDDVIFAKDKSRVNNCGKRILIDQAAPRVANGDYDIILVGHRDNDEGTAAAGRHGRRGRHAEANPLDEQRALNAAAVLSGGTGTCGKVDPARIKVLWVGTDQTSEAKPGLCGTSNMPETKERKGSTVTEADKNRRVEVYLVPHNGQGTPSSLQNAQPLPEKEMKRLACPK